jgi:hypothetical protein
VPPRSQGLYQLGQPSQPSHLLARSDGGDDLLGPLKVARLTQGRSYSN